MMNLQYDRLSGAFVLPRGVDSEVATDVCAKLNAALVDVRARLDLKRAKGKFAHGFAAELALHSVGRRYNVHSIYDEIGKLEGTDPRPSCTKKPEPMLPPLRGLWHKHHHQVGFLVKNLTEETKRMAKDGHWEKMFPPHYGKYVHEFADPVAHQMVVGAYECRTRDHRLTGEFIVYKPQPDGSNYYLTLGSRGEYNAIRARVDA